MFRPMPLLTLVTAIALAFLIHLGNWQADRLVWKTELIEQIDRAAQAPAFETIDEVRMALEEGQPIDFRRIMLRGEWAAPQNPPHQYHWMQTRERNMHWRAYQPFVTWALYPPNEYPVFVGHDIWENGATAALPKSGKAEITGYVRLVRPLGRFAMDSNPDQNRWFNFNGAPQTQDWADMLGKDRKIETRYYVDKVDVDHVSDLPVRKPELRNNHLDYMLTWYSFAVILLVIYLIMHHRQGRLKFK